MERMDRGSNGGWTDGLRIKLRTDSSDAGKTGQPPGGLGTDCMENKWRIRQRKDR